MAVKTDVLLLAESGDVTVARRTAFYTYGKFDVILPEGQEQEETDSRLTDGYIARAHDGNVGRFDFGFIRADATVNIDAGTSDLETQIDSAELRSEGDVFFEGDIGAEGFNGFVPGVDFDTGDIVSVTRWGSRLALPVTDIEYEVSDSGGPRASRVHVSGQLIHDAASRRRSNDEIRQQIAAEKRERLRQVGAVDEKATQAKDTADSALNAVNDADGVIQGYVKSAADYSRESHEHSEASQRHSTDAKAYSDLSHVYSQQSQQISAQSVAHSALSIEHSEESHKYSQQSQEHSEASFAHSDAARIYSDAANSASQQAKQYSEQVQDLQPTIEQAASDAQTASEQSSQYSAESKTASEQSSIHSQAATDAADLSQESLRLAELARDAAETSRRDAETKRDEAEQARKAGFAAMTAAAAAMAQAEQSRADAEEQRRLAENERAAAEDQRRLAETARSAAEGARDSAEQKRAAAETARSGAETARSGAESARDTAEQKRAAAESERALAESARDTAEQKRAAAETEREKAETARAQTVEAWQATQEAINDEQNELIEQLKSQQEELAKVQSESANIIMATSAGTSYPGVNTRTSSGGYDWEFTIPDTRGALAKIEYWSGTGVTKTLSEVQVSSVSSSGLVIRTYADRFIQVTWAKPRAIQRSISGLSTTAVTPSQTTWRTISDISITAGNRASQGYVTVKARWSAANRGSTYGIRLVVNGVAQSPKYTSTLGPLTFLQDGESTFTARFTNVSVPAGQRLQVQVYSTASSSSARRVNRVELTGSWIETA